MNRVSLTDASGDHPRGRRWGLEVLSAMRSPWALHVNPFESPVRSSLGHGSVQMFRPRFV